jgi:hypothetical protein
MLKTTKITLKVHETSDEVKEVNEVKGVNGLKGIKEVTEWSWMDQFRTLSTKNKSHARYWFWDNFNWHTQSLWIGKLNKINHLPPKDTQINDFLKKLIDDLDCYPEIKKNIYIKLYFSRNTHTKEPDINYLLICNTPELPEEFSNTLLSVIFERYQLTERIINKDDNFKNLVNHYINWNNFYNYYDLMGVLQY